MWFLLQQVEALLKAVGSDFCSDWTDWLDDKVSGHEDKKNTPLSPMLETFLHSNPADYSTKKLQVIDPLRLLVNRLHFR